MIIVKFSPTALDFGYDFVLLVHLFLGHPVYIVNSWVLEEYAAISFPSQATNLDMCGQSHSESIHLDTEYVHYWSKLRDFFLHYSFLPLILTILTLQSKYSEGHYARICLKTHSLSFGKLSFLDWIDNPCLSWQSPHVWSCFYENLLNLVHKHVSSSLWPKREKKGLIWKIVPQRQFIKWASLRLT